MKWTSLLIMTLFGGCMGGCSITTKNQGETGLRYGTEITFFHRAAQTAPEQAKIESNADSLFGWIKELWKKPEPVVDPDPWKATKVFAASKGFGVSETGNGIIVLSAPGTDPHSICPGFSLESRGITPPPLPSPVDKPKLPSD